MRRATTLSTLSGVAVIAVPSSSSPKTSCLSTFDWGSSFVSCLGETLTHAIRHGIAESMEERDYFREVVRPGALAPKPLHYISRDGKIHSTHITFDPPVSSATRVKV